MRKRAGIIGVISLLAVVGVLFCLGLSSCAAISAWGEDLNRELKGVSATMTTYTQQGAQIDQVHGRSFQVSRDDRFDSVASDGSSNNDSQVLLISLGRNHISHVGSSMIMAQDGLSDIMSQVASSDITIDNTDRGSPWLNDLVERHRNLWKGKGKTIMVRSQDGTPIAVYAGKEVEIFGTDVPKATRFRVDGKYLLVYRSDYTVYDTALLQ